MHPDVAKAFEKTRAELTRLGHEVIAVSLPTLDHVVSAYYVIATAEASANLGRFDGVRYGERSTGADNPEELMIATRTEGFGEEVKLRILLGTYVLRSGFQDEYYIRAQRIRTAIRNDFQKAFTGVDLVLMPVYPVPPFVRGSADADPFTQKLADVFTCAANLAGLPAMSFPAGLAGGLPIGMQFLAPPLAEDLLFAACRELEKTWPSPDPPGFPAEWR
jgi:aspartyl-tRNA(Asn)/glutamyl-tRNA(Gln) amidotransferase subunit A